MPYFSGGGFRRSLPREHGDIFSGVDHHKGFLRLSVAEFRSSIAFGKSPAATLTFEVKQHVRLIFFEHLRHELHVHILYVDFLEIFSSTRSSTPQQLPVRTWRLLFKTSTASLSFSWALCQRKGPCRDGMRS